MKTKLFLLLFITTMSYASNNAIYCQYGDVISIAQGGKTGEMYLVPHSAINSLCASGKDWGKGGYYAGLQTIVQWNKSMPGTSYITNPGQVFKGWGYTPCVEKDNAKKIRFPFARWHDKNKKDADLDFLYCDLSTVPTNIQQTCANMNFATCN